MEGNYTTTATSVSEINIRLVVWPGHRTCENVVYVATYQNTVIFDIYVLYLRNYLEIRTWFPYFSRDTHLASVDTNS